MVADPTHLQCTGRQRLLLVVQKLLELPRPFLRRGLTCQQIGLQEVELGIVGQIGHAMVDVCPRVLLGQQTDIVGARGDIRPEWPDTFRGPRRAKRGMDDW